MTDKIPIVIGISLGNICSLFVIPELSVTMPLILTNVTILLLALTIKE